MRDKLFFFGGYQGTPTRQTPADNIAYVPTAAMLAGDFTAFASPACNGGRQITLRAPFVNNRVDPALVQPGGDEPRQAAADDRPIRAARSGSAWRDDRDEGQAVGRVDYQWSANHTRVRPLHGHASTTSRRPLQQVRQRADDDDVGVDNMAQSLTLGDTLVFGANMVNSLRFAFNRTVVDRFNEPFFEPKDLGRTCTTTRPRGKWS